MAVRTHPSLDGILDRPDAPAGSRRAGEPFRRRKAAKDTGDLRDGLAKWMEAHADQLADAEPEMPPGLVDRPADVWEAPLAVADLATAPGRPGPERRR